MKFKRSRLGVLLSVASACTVAATTPDLAADLAVQDSQKVKSTDQQPYIVLFKNAAGINPKNAQQRHSSPSVFNQGKYAADKAQNLVSAVGGKVYRSLKSIKGIAAELNPMQLEQLRRNPEVKLIEQDPKRDLQSQTAPYGISMIQADQVSDAQTGNLTVCVLDTGYDISHEDLSNSANITGETSNTLTANIDIGEWSNDSYGHGTHVAGIISALDNTSGVVGVNPNGNINIHNVKIIDHSGWWRWRGSDMIAGIEACQAAGAKVVNMSLSGNKSSVAEEQAMQAAYDSGMVLVSAAGNGGSSAYYYPASYDSVISVGAVDSAASAWMYTHTNDQIEVTAPGVSVRSTLPGNQYANWDGTSMAAAHVSGVAGLIWSQHPNCSHEQVREALRQSALDKGDPGLDHTYGYGIVQAKAASDWLTAANCTAPMPTTYSHLVQVAEYSSASIDFLPAGLNISANHGSVVWDAPSSSYIYTPNVAGFSGVDNLIYTLDGQTQMIRVEVNLLSNGSGWGVSNDGSDQLESQLTALSNGDFVMVWTQTDSGVDNIYYRRYNGIGAVISDITEVDVSPLHQRAASVTATENGGFTIAWQESTETYIKRFDGNNIPFANRTTLGNGSYEQDNTSIATLNNNRTIVVWDDETSLQLKASLIESNGNVLISAFSPFGGMIGEQKQATVLAKSNGGFMMASIINNQLITMHFNQDGYPTSAFEVVSTAPTPALEDIKQISLTELSGGQTVIAWTTLGGFNNIEKVVMARIYAADGSATTTEFMLSNPNSGPGDKQSAQVVAQNNGGFLAIWQSRGHLVAREFEHTSAPTSVEFRVTASNVYQQQPSASVLADGRIAVTYNEGSSNHRVKLAFVTPGTDNADVLQGDSLDNILVGNAGNNTLYGDAGNDTLYDGALAFGGDGNDLFFGGQILNGGNGDDTFNGDSGGAFFSGHGVIDGGAGFDVVQVKGASTEFTLTDNGDGSYLLVDNNPGSPQGSKTLTNVEAIAFADIFLGL